ncbi:MAG TPA: S41 family peptidase [Candidatus Cybelea sp.]|nr:S41 family peptidase [Candidatus Cybelea sp.]
MPDLHDLRDVGAGRLPGARFLLLLVTGSVLVLGACSTSSTLSPSEAARRLDHDMFVSGFEDIDQIYITSPDIGALTLAGLQQLSTIDPDISTRREGDTVELLLKEHPVENIAVNDHLDPQHWGDLAADVLNEARQESPKIAATPPEKIYEAVFDGVVGKLDQFSHYASAANAADLRADRDGFGGIGVTISVEDEVVRVVSVMHYTPADRLGILRDDLITEIDGTPTTGMSQRDVVDRLRGPVGSRVALTLKRHTQDDPIQVSLIRTLVVPETVAYQREGDIAYFRIYRFNAGTTDTLKRSIRDAKAEIGESLRGYVLDLRGNPGGLLSQAVSVANLFLDHGKIVSTMGRNPDSHQFFEATEGDITDGKPIAVLIDGNSASAAEILAAALQDNERAVVIGSNSYGKGTVQNVVTLPNKGEITLTWARFHAPSGYTLHHLGVLPTVCTAGQKDAGTLIAELSAGKLQGVPTAERNSIQPDDTTAMDALRKTCPGRHEPDAIDLDTAVRLLNRPNLFAEALRLAVPPVLSAGEPAAAKENVSVLP